MRTEPFGPHDGAWVAVASLLEQATLVSNDERDVLLRDAVELAHEILGESNAFRVAEAEWGLVERGPSEVIVLLADQAYDAGALHLARAMLDALLAVDVSLSDVQRGRLLARRARADGRLGRMDEAADQYRALGRLGRQLENDELRARAWIGLGALAQMRGNYPEQRRYSRRAARVADRSELRYLSRLAHFGLMIAAGAQHRFEEALRHATIVYRVSLGDPVLEGESLQSIGQLMLEAGHPALANVAFAAVLSRPLPLRLHLPSLGGLALANAALGAEERVLWAMRELERLEPTSILPYAFAAAALECASALTTIRRDDDATRLLALAVRIANQHGYYEVLVKADEIHSTPVPSPAQQPLGRTATRLVREIHPERLPDRLVSAAAVQ